MRLGGKVVCTHCVAAVLTAFGILEKKDTMLF